MNEHCQARRVALLGFSLILGASCLPRTGHVTIYGDGAATAEGIPGKDQKLQVPDTGPRPDGLPPKLDTLVPPKPDAAVTPGGPQPPFGTTQGMTAKNFTGVPDCAGTAYGLHSIFQQKKGVIIAMMSPS
jgi:hypothetical protein